MARRGSPLLIGVKTDKKLKVDFVDVEVATENDKVELSELFLAPMSSLRLSH